MSRESLRVALKFYEEDVAEAFNAKAKDGWVKLGADLFDIAELIEDISSKIITFDLRPALYVFGPNFKKRPQDISRE